MRHAGHHDDRLHQHAPEIRLQRDGGSGSTASCTQDPGPPPVAPGGVITPPSSAPPLGLTYTLYDTDGNELYTTTGRLLACRQLPVLPDHLSAVQGQQRYPQRHEHLLHQHPAVRVAAMRHDQRRRRGHAAGVRRAGRPDPVVHAGREQRRPARHHDLHLRQRRRAADRDGAGRERLWRERRQLHDHHCVERRRRADLGHAGQRQRATPTRRGPPATPTTATATRPRSRTPAATPPRPPTTPTIRPTLVTNPDSDATLTCYDGDGNVAQTVPPVGVAANSLTVASCPTVYPAGYSDRLASDATMSHVQRPRQDDPADDPGPGRAVRL